MENLLNKNLREIARNAGGILISSFKRSQSVELKSDGSPVTKVDRECDRYLQQSLTSLLDIPVLSEETTDNRSRIDSEWVWVIDPLDGTKEFVNEVPEFALSIGLLHRAQPVGGVVFNPATDEGGVCGPNEPAEFWGISQPANRILVSRSEVARYRGQYPEELGVISPVGSIAYKLLLVAACADRFTFTIDPKSEWDILGGAALLRSVKKPFSTLDGTEIRYNTDSVRFDCGFIAGDFSASESELVRAMFSSVHS